MGDKPWADVQDRLDVLAFFGSEQVELRPHGETYATGLCPFHDDDRASLSVSLESGKRGMFRCHGCGEHGSAFDFYQKRHNVDFPSALRAVAKYAPGVMIDEAPVRKTQGPRSVVAQYVYTDEIGKPLFRVVRYEPKAFSQQRMEGGEWVNGLKDTRRVLYRLPEVVTAVHEDKAVFVVEGEKDSDNCRTKLNVCATTSPMGAGKWQQEYSVSLAGAQVVLVPDNDAIGRKHMLEVAKSLYESGCRVKFLDLPGIPPKGDISDWIEMGGDEMTLAFLIERTKEWKPAKAGPELTRADSIVPKEVEWLWEGRIPKGKLSLIVGDPGLGKSTITLDIAARISKGLMWPDRGQASRGEILILSAEDGLEDTVVPRLMKLGADRAHIYAMTGVIDSDGTSRWFTLDKDLAHVAAAIEEVQPMCVIIDPINAYMGDTDSHQDTQVRRILNPLQDMADRYGTAIIGVMHLNKNTQTKAAYRIGGSIAYLAAARSVSYVVPDPEEDDKRYFVTDKMNLAAKPAPLALRLNGSIEWEPDPVKGLDLEQLLMEKAPKEESSALYEAVEFLETEVPAGAEVPSIDLLKRAKELGIAERTMKRAKAEMPWLKSVKVGDKWLIRNTSEPRMPDGPNGTLGPVGPLPELGTLPLDGQEGQVNQEGQEGQEYQGGHSGTVPPEGPPDEPPWYAGG